MIKNKKGFTIIELLIVIVIIGILITITAVTFRGFVERAQDTSMQAKARIVGKKAEVFNAKSGSFGILHTQYYPPAMTKSQVLEVYDLTEMSNQIYLWPHDANELDFFDKSLIHMRSYKDDSPGYDADMVEVGYWSNEKDTWIIDTYSKDGISSKEYHFPPGIPPGTS